VILVLTVDGNLRIDAGENSKGAPSSCFPSEIIIMMTMMMTMMMTTMMMIMRWRGEEKGKEEVDDDN
jgi:flagellar basal body-associated protein FliL